MSLINNMLQDLEERQALAGIRDYKVLGDLHASHERNPRGPGNRMHSLLLLLAGLLVCYLGYNFYDTMSVPVSAPVIGIGGSLEQHVAGNDRIKTAVPRPHVAAHTPETDLQSGIDAITLKFASLKMDTSTFKTPLPQAPVAAGSDSAGNAQAVTSDTTSPDTAPVSPVNRLLHIGLTDLAGGSAVLINTSSYPDYSVFLLQKPDRLLVEIKGLEMPEGIVQASYKSDAVARLRHGSRGNTGLLIFDLNRPVHVNSTDVREMPGGGYSLDLELLEASSPGVAADGGAASPVAASEATHQTFQKNASFTGDARMLKDAMGAYHGGDIVHAIDLLYRILKRDPQQLKARATLATILMQQQDRVSAVKILSEGLRLHPDNADLIKLYAKLLFEEGQLEQALAWLQQAQPDISVDPDYYALMAAVLQRRKDYPDAGQLYRRLVEIQPANGVWWIGLGISLEGTGHSAEALQAYANARKDRTLTADLSHYIDTRIKTLGG